MSCPERECSRLVNQARLREQQNTILPSSPTERRAANRDGGEAPAALATQRTHGNPSVAFRLVCFATIWGLSAQVGNLRNPIRGNSHPTA